MRKFYFLLIILTSFLFTKAQTSPCLKNLNSTVEKFYSSYGMEELIDPLSFDTFENCTDYSRISTKTKLQIAYIKKIKAHYTFLRKDISQAINLLDTAIQIGKKINQEHIGIALLTKGNVYAYNYETDSAIQYYQQAKKYFPKVKSNNEWLNILYIKLAFVEFRKGNKTESKKLLDSAYQGIDTSKDNISYAQYLIIQGTISLYANEYKETIDFLNQSIILSKKNNLNELHISALRKKAIVFSKLGMLKEAEKTFKTALSSIDAKAATQDYIGIIHTDLGQLYIQTNAIDSAKKQFVLAQDFYTKTGDSLDLIYSLEGLAKIHFISKEYDTGYALLQKARQLAEAKNITNTIPTFLSIEAIAKFEQGAYSESIQLAKESNRLAKQINQSEIRMNNYEVLSKTYAKMKLWDSAYHSLLQFNQLQSKINSDAVKKAVKGLEFKYNLLVQENKMIELKQKLEKSQQQKLRMLILLIGIITFLIFLLSILWLRGKAKNYKLSVKEKELEIQKLKEDTYLSKIEAFKQQIVNSNQMIEDLKKIGSQTSEQVIDQLINEKNWTQFLVEFELLHKGFIQDLKTKSPSLSNNELRFLALLKLNIPDKEIAKLLNIEYESVRKIRYRIKKKISEDNDLL